MTDKGIRIYAHLLITVLTASTGSDSVRIISTIRRFPISLFHRLKATNGKSDHSILIPEYKKNRNNQGFSRTICDRLILLLDRMIIPIRISIRKKILSTGLPSSSVP
jgi:hypothetical protein